ncbi:MAG TPA: response regulator, partial [Polyangiaceae bacterium]
MPPEPEAREEAARLADARADFVASLPRRLEALRQALRQAEEAPGDADRVNGLLRRAHAVGSAARVLGFASVAEALAEAERAVRKGQAGKAVSLDEMARALDLLPSLVLGAPVSTRSPESRARGLPEGWPLNVLVLGPQSLGDAIQTGEGTARIECERASDAGRALELARVTGPDVVVVDGDDPSAREFVTRALGDSLIDPVPIVVVADFENAENTSHFVELGAARVLPKPCSPDTLRRTVEVLRERAAKPRGVREPLGELSVEKLSERIAAEFRRGLVDALDSGSPDATVALGEGHDVLAAVWGAVARVRELVTLRSSGNLRFEAAGPEGAIPLAALTERRAGDRGPSRTREAGVSLQGRRIVVADDDPAVVWFLSGLLKAVGVEVLEAHDGKRALELAFESWPDAVISDVLMPKLDGFSLCHEIKRDVAVRDVPVILLSWKEDLLQRVRELGAAADGYLRKEAAASTVVERVREVLRPRARVEERMAAGGEVRGRLDGLTPRLILELACREERDVRISLRDAAYLFEAQIRRGQLVGVTRSSVDGKFVRGPAVLGSLLGAGAGRFVVEPDSSPARAEVSGPLREVLAEPIRRARAGLASVSASSLVRLRRLDVDAELMESYLACTPEPAAGVARRVLGGESPAELVLSGAVAPRLLEVVLSDIARRDGVANVELDPAPFVSSVPPPVVAAEPASASEPLSEDAAAWLAAAVEAEPEPEPGASTKDGEPATEAVSPPPERVEAAADVAPPSSEPTSGPSPESSSEAPDSEPRLPFSDQVTPAADGLTGPLFDFGPGPARTLEGVGNPPVAEAVPVSEPAVPSSQPEPPEKPGFPVSSHQPAKTAVPARSEPPPDKDDGGEAPESLGVPLEPSRLPTIRPKEREERKRRERAGERQSWMSVLFRTLLAGGVAFGVTSWLILPLFSNGERRESTDAEPAASAAVPAPPVARGPVLVLTSEELDPPSGMELPPGHGLLEIETPGPDSIYVDEAFVGRGPTRRVPAPAGRHSVEIKSETQTSRIDASLAAGRRVRIAAIAVG